MINENALDLICIVINSGVHAGIVLYFIDHKENVIVERPIAISIVDANEIIRRAKQNDVKVSACNPNWFNLAVQEKRRELEEDCMVKLLYDFNYVRWNNRDENCYNQAGCHGKWAPDGGSLKNQCIYDFDLSRWMLGDEIEEVYSVTRQQLHNYLECEDIGMDVIKVKNGAIGTIEGTENVYPRNLEETLYLFGDTGIVKLGSTLVELFASPIQFETGSGKSCHTEGKRL